MHYVAVGGKGECKKMSNEVTKRGYKVVYMTSDGRLWSATSCGCGNQVEYKIGSAVFPHPGDGPLAVFNELKFAMDFGIFPRHKVYQCIYTKSTENRLWRMYSGSDGTQEVCSVSDDLPYGTAFASSVTLQEEVPR